MMIQRDHLPNLASLVVLLLHRLPHISHQAPHLPAGEEKEIIIKKHNINKE